MGPADAAFELAPQGGGTQVTWTFETELGMNPIKRYFGLMLDRLLGADYEAGLTALKALVESNTETTG
jgi:carbon monoxide dehydrogenase subunit G